MAYTPQQQKVITHIDRWGSINSIEAIRHYGITRLAARIHELKNSNRAMKAIVTEQTAPGFVAYVPDWEQRRKNLMERQMRDLKAASGPRIAEVNIKYTAKFALLNTKEREYLQEHR